MVYELYGLTEEEIQIISNFERWHTNLITQN